MPCVHPSIVIVHVTILLVFRWYGKTISYLIEYIGAYVTFREGQVSLCDFGKSLGIILKIFLSLIDNESS